MGGLADIDDKLSLKAFEECKERLEAWLDEIMDEEGKERPVTIVGHSLGGALAMRLMSHIPAKFHPWISLITYSSAGVDEETVSKIPADRTRMIWHELDPVTLFSGHHPNDPNSTGRYEIANRINTDTVTNLVLEAHTKKFLVEWQLLSRPLRFRKVNSADHRLHEIGDPIRRSIGWVCRQTIQGFITP